MERTGSKENEEDRESARNLVVRSYIIAESRLDNGE
jgi:hypothetical protein